MILKLLVTIKFSCEKCYSFYNYMGRADLINTFSTTSLFEPDLKLYLTCVTSRISFHRLDQL